MQLILASQSPRRKDLLGFFHIPFVIRVPHVDETMDPALCVEDAVAEVCRRKAEAVGKNHPEKLNAFLDEYKASVKYVNENAGANFMMILGAELAITTEYPEVMDLDEELMAKYNDEGYARMAAFGELMGKKPEFRFRFITEHAQFVKDLFV